MYGVEVSPDLISRVTDGVVDELREWQNRPAYLAIGVDTEGRKHIFGVWLGDAGEGAVPVAGHIKIDRADLGEHPLRGGPAAAVARTAPRQVAALITQLERELFIPGPLESSTPTTLAGRSCWPCRTTGRR
jgi:hypothetical protein